MRAHPYEAATGGSIIMASGGSARPGLGPAACERWRAIRPAPCPTSDHPKSERSPVTKRQYEALATFRYQLRRFLRYSEQVSRQHGLTPLQYQLMLQVKGYPARDWATVTELAERLQAKHHGVVALITRCEKRGLLQRRADENDRRTVRVQLTAKGEKALSRLAQLHRDELLAVRDRFIVPTLDELTPSDASASSQIPQGVERVAKKRSRSRSSS